MPSVTPFRPAPEGEVGAPSAPSALSSRTVAASRLWRVVTLCTLLGLFGWLVLTVGVVWFARDLDQWTVARVPAGYWWAAQGAIGGYILIIVIYCGLMEWLEARLPHREPHDAVAQQMNSGPGPVGKERPWHG